MPRERLGPDKAWLERTLRKHRDPQTGEPPAWTHVAALYEKETGIKLTSMAFSIAARRYEIDVPPRTVVRYTEELPWSLGKHKTNKWARMLRWYGAVRAAEKDGRDPDVSEADLRRMESRIAELQLPQWDEDRKSYRYKSIAFSKSRGVILVWREDGDRDLGRGVFIVPPRGGGGSDQSNQGKAAA